MENQYAFLSYAPENEAAVEAVARRLRDELQLPVWFAPWHATPGADFQRELEDALLGARACVVFVGGGAGGVAGWQSEELRAAIEERVAGGGYRVLVAFLPGDAPVARRQLPPFLRNTVHPGLEIRFGAGNDEQALRRLAAGVRGVAPEGAPAPSPLPAARVAPAYASLTITIAPGADAASRTVIARGPGGDAQSVLHLPPGGSAAYQFAEQSTAGVVRQVGELLFGLLFDGAVRDLYARSQGALRSNERLRLVFVIDAADTTVAALPWEVLHDPQVGPLALLGVSPVRYMPRAQPVPPLRVSGPMRVLLSAAQTPPPAPVERELLAAESALAAGRSRFSVTTEAHIRVDRLRERLREGVHVWHFVGHAAVSGGLLFEDAQDDAQMVSAAELQALFSQSGVRLVLLSGCDTARPADDSPASVAAALLAAQVAAVVAMQFRVSGEATRAFTAELFETLALGWPLDACVSEGRKAVQSIAPGRVDWAIPVLYTRAVDGVLFE
jgi:hypothetical protein